MMDSLGRDLVAYAVLMALIALAGSIAYHAGGALADLVVLSRDGDVNEARWFPKSLCARVADGRYQVEGWKLRQEGFLDRVSASQGRLGL